MNFFAKLCMGACTLLVLISCQNLQTQSQTFASGEWRMSLITEAGEIPFNTTLTSAGKNKYILEIRNGEERITAESVYNDNDTLHFNLPVFNSTLTLVKESPDLLGGVYNDMDRDDYRIAIIGEHGKDFRFTPSLSSTEIPLRYKVRFGSPSQGYDAVLLLNNDKGKLTGTFMTETGDYRFLQGDIMNNSIYLSTFDGSHAWLFHADIVGDSLANGTFVSGIHYSNTWAGKADGTFKLGNPFELTYVRGSDRLFTFNMINQSGDSVKHTDFIDGFRVNVYEIMGSWCPNCSDASIAMHQLASTFPKEQVRIVPIAFERSASFTQSKPRIDKMLSDLGLPHFYLFGGKAARECTFATLPTLDTVRSYPTIVFTNKRGEVAYIFTGFYGPGTGEMHQSYQEEFRRIIQQLVNA